MSASCVVQPAFHPGLSQPFAAGPSVHKAPTQSRPRLSLNITTAHAQDPLNSSAHVHNLSESRCVTTVHNTPVIACAVSQISNSNRASHSPSSSPPSTSTTASFSVSSSSPPQTPLSAPYSLAPHLRSILTNSPIVKRFSSCNVQLSAACSSSKSVITKRVDFRDPAQEDIYTIDYTHTRSVSSTNNSKQTTAHRRAEERAVTACADPRNDHHEVDLSDSQVGAPRKRRKLEWTWTLPSPTEDEDAADAVLPAWESMSSHVTSPAVSTM